MSFHGVVLIRHELTLYKKIRKHGNNEGSTHILEKRKKKVMNSRKEWVDLAGMLFFRGSGAMQLSTSSRLIWNARRYLLSVRNQPPIPKSSVHVHPPIQHLNEGGEIAACSVPRILNETKECVQPFAYQSKGFEAAIKSGWERVKVTKVLALDALEVTKTNFVTI